MTKRQEQISLSYEQIVNGRRTHIEQLAEADLMDDETRARLAHLGRFYQTISRKMPEGATVGEAFSEQELYAIWVQTAGDLPMSILH